MDMREDMRGDVFDSLVSTDYDDDNLHEEYQSSISHDASVDTDDSFSLRREFLESLDL